MVLRMAANGKSDDHGTGRRAKSAADTPAWADGLKQLYDTVVDEPIPNSFMDLLAQLDASDDDRGASGSGGEA